MLQWMSDLVEQGGYAGIAVLMLMENLFPPIPSEVIMPVAGYAAAKGDLNLALVILSGSLGSIAGAAFWYYVGLWLGYERVRKLAARHGRWLTVSPQDIDHSREWFGRHSGKAVFFGRLVPAIRTLISLPAGIAQMSMPKFLMFTAVGTLMWTGALAYAGYLLGEEHQTVVTWIDPASKTIVAALLLAYIYRVVTFKRQNSGTES